MSRPQCGYTLGELAPERYQGKRAISLASFQNPTHDVNVAPGGG